MARMLTALLLVITLWSCTKPEPASPASEAAASGVSDFAAQMLEEVNALRATGCRCGSRQMPPVPALKWNGQLEQASRRHADDMKNNGFFSHTGSDGSSMSARVSQAGYAWRAVAENIAWGYPNVSSVVEGWKDSPGHCENMMSGSYTEMGAARAGTYWVQDLGRR